MSTAQTIDANDIKIGYRQREVEQSSEAYRQLKENIADHGIIEPIVLVRLGNSRPHLVAGMHRLTALKELGRPTLRHGHEYIWLDTKGLTPREVVCKAQFAEVYENVHKVQLSPRQHAKFVMRAATIHAREELAKRRRQLVEARQRKIEVDRIARGERRKAKELQDKLEAARKAERDGEARKLRERLVEQGEIAKKAENARTNQNHVTRRLEQDMAYILRVTEVEPDVRVSSQDKGASARKITSRNYVQALASRLRLSHQHVNRVRRLMGDVGRFISQAELEAHPICKKIDTMRGEFSHLVDMAAPAATFYHRGLREWCDDVRAHKNVQLPSALRERIKAEEAEARRKELAADEKKAFQAAVSEYRGIVASIKSFKAKVVGNHAKSPHARVKELARRELQTIERIVQALDDMGTRIDGTVAAYKSDRGE